MQKNIRTVCFLKDNDEILLAETVYSSRIRKFTGIGGEVTSEKRLELETVQYLYDDLRITVYTHDLEKVGVLHRVSENEKNEIIADETLFIFLCEKWQGEIKATPGRKPQWFTLDTIPYNETLEYEEKWLPLIMDQEKVLIEILEKKNPDFGEFETVNIAVRDAYTSL